MPSHFEGKERLPEEVPWGTNPSRSNESGSCQGSNQNKLTTYGWMFQGNKGLPAKSYRNSTTNHFDPQNWRNKSSYNETFFTPNAYSRHAVQKFSVNRNHRPHPQQLIWPLEPYKGYMIWKPKMIPDDEVKRYSAPSLLRQYKDVNKWCTTNQTTYKNYYARNQQPLSSKAPLQQRVSGDDVNSREISSTQSKQRDQLSSSQNNLNSRLDSRKAHTTDPCLRTSYKSNFTGEPMKPSTNEKPADRSWRNIRY